VSIHLNPVRRTAGIAIVGLIAAAVVWLATPAPAKQTNPQATLAKNKCSQAKYSDRTQAPGNAAGIVFNPRGDKFHMWDNERDNQIVAYWFNYAGVNDKWKGIKGPDDGGQRVTTRNLDERYNQICFVAVTHHGQSPIVRFTTRP
jgi:hypothetical protein